MPELEVDISAPEPPSKKALRKAKKHKTASSHPAEPKFTAGKPASVSSELANSETETATKASAQGVWIGNLHFSTTKADLRRFLTTGSTITDKEITRVHLPMLHSSSSTPTSSKAEKGLVRNKGFAYVDLASSRALQEALALSEKLLGGRRLLIKDANSFEGRPEKSRRDDITVKNGIAPSKRIFVGNLGFDVTKEDLLERFEPCGKVTYVHTATFEDSGKCKGYAWVEFEDIEAAKAAIKGWVTSVEQSDSEGEKRTASLRNEQIIQSGQAEKLAKKSSKTWVNRIKGRQLRMEFAEDKSVRYQKRFGKDGSVRKDVHVPELTNTHEPNTPSEGNKAEPAAAERLGREKSLVGKKTGDTAKAESRPNRDKRAEARSSKPQTATAYLTGAICDSAGTKIRFTS